MKWWDTDRHDRGGEEGRRVQRRCNAWCYMIPNDCEGQHYYCISPSSNIECAGNLPGNDNCSPYYRGKATVTSALLFPTFYSILGTEKTKITAVPDPLQDGHQRHLIILGSVGFLSWFLWFDLTKWCIMLCYLFCILLRSLWRRCDHSLTALQKVGVLSGEPL